MDSTKKLFFITNIPAFYKIRLFNEIVKQRDVSLLFLEEGESNRNQDFYNESVCFHFQTWSKLSFIQKLSSLLALIGNQKCEILIGGLDHFLFWVYAFLSPKSNNAILCESSYHESKTSGLKGLLKKIFLSRISTAYVPGKSNAELLKRLNFHGTIIKTRGVGLYRRVRTPVYHEKKTIKKFLYVGRLSPEKNLIFLINVFNKHPEYELTIAGFGPQDAVLKQIAGDNISFTGAVENRKLPELYQKHDVFILFSISEPWGMVVEEALNNGLPVIVSDKVGCAEEIVEDGINGFTIPVNDEERLIACIKKISVPAVYNQLRKNVCSKNYEEIEQQQINAYLQKV